MVEKFRHVVMESGGECFGFVEFGMYLLKCSFFTVVGFSKCKSLYLNEREKCYGRQIYAFNPHKMVKICVMRTS